MRYVNWFQKLVPDARNGFLGHIGKTCLEGVTFEDQVGVFSLIGVLELNNVTFCTHCSQNEGVAGYLNVDGVSALTAGAKIKAKFTYRARGSPVCPIV